MVRRAAVSGKATHRGGRYIRAVTYVNKCCRTMQVIRATAAVPPRTRLQSAAPPRRRRPRADGHPRGPRPLGVGAASPAQCGRQTRAAEPSWGGGRQPPSWRCLRDEMPPPRRRRAPQPEPCHAAPRAGSAPPLPSASPASRHIPSALLLSPFPHQTLLSYGAGALRSPSPSRFPRTPACRGGLPPLHRVGCARRRTRTVAWKGGQLLLPN